MEGAAEKKMKLISILVILFSIVACQAQDNSSFCKAVESGRFNKVERKFKRMVRSIPESSDYSDTLKTEPRMDENIESLTQRLKGLPCVDDAFQDKCQIKILIYPGWSIIGVKFRTNAGVVEKCFSIQLGTTGTTNIFGWRAKTGRAKNKLVYRKMYDCTDFISDQKQNCLVK